MPPLACCVGNGKQLHIFIDGTVVKNRWLRETDKGQEVEDQQAIKHKWDVRYAVEEPDDPEPIPFVREVSASLQPCRALCLAAGSGRNAVFLAQQGFEVTAIDISPVGLGCCAALAHSRGVEVELIEADLLTYPFVDQFGLVTMVYYNEPSLFPKLQDAVKPGGSFLFQTYSVHHANQDWGPSNPAFLADPKAVMEAFKHWRIRRFEDGDFQVAGADLRTESIVRLLAQK